MKLHAFYKSRKLRKKHWATHVMTLHKLAKYKNNVIN